MVALQLYRMLKLSLWCLYTYEADVASCDWLKNPVFFFFFLNIASTKSLDLASPNPIISSPNTQTHTSLTPPVLIWCAGSDSVRLHAGLKPTNR